MLFEIKPRIYRLDRKLIDLIPELKKRGIDAVPSEISVAIAGLRTSKKFADIVSASNEIVTEWEKESTNAKNKTCR